MTLYVAGAMVMMEDVVEDALSCGFGVEDVVEDVSRVGLARKTWNQYRSIYYISFL